MVTETKAKAAQVKAESTPIIVTTAHKGVFFGYGDPVLNAARQVRLTNARMAVYWSQDVKGVLGLGATGPTSNCKIGTQVPAITLNDITSIIECSEAAAKAWESAPWS